MDVRLLLWINGWAGQFLFLDGLMLALGEWVFPVVPLVLTWLWFRPGAGRVERRVEAVLLALALLLALGLSDLPAIVYARLRPYEVYEVTLLTRPSPTPSFPSAHVAVAAAMAAVRSWRGAGWALTVGCMVARVYIGVHYPFDVLGGLVAGWLGGAVVHGNRDALRAFALRVVAFGEELL